MHESGRSALIFSEFREFLMLWGYHRGRFYLQRKKGRFDISCKHLKVVPVADQFVEPGFAKTYDSVVPYLNCIGKFWSSDDVQ